MRGNCRPGASLAVLGGEEPSGWWVVEGACVSCAKDALFVGARDLALLAHVSVQLVEANDGRLRRRRWRVVGEVGAVSELEGAHSVAVGARLASVLVENSLALVVWDVAVRNAVGLPQLRPILEKFRPSKRRDDIATAASQTVHLHCTPLFHVGVVQAIGRAIGHLHRELGRGKFFLCEKRWARFFITSGA
jgi:hypothetical protein